MCTYWNKVSFKRSTSKNKKRIDSIGIGLASPEEIRHWGERRLPNGTLVGKVEKDHTVDYESLKPIEGGLFCERIFGPVEDFYCSCERRGEKNEKFCPDCEVEFTKSRVRRTRMGYIPLAVPVAHVWYLRGRPSYIANFIGKSRNTVDKLAYGETLCESFVGNTSTNYLKHGLEHLVESKKCRILNFDSSNLDLLVLSQKQELLNKQKKVSEELKKEKNVERLSSLSPDYNLFGWRSSYLKLLACKFALQANVGFFLKNPKHENHRVDQGTVESRFIPATIKLQSNPDRNLPSSGHFEYGKRSLVKSSLASFKFPVIPEKALVNGIPSTGTPLTGVPSTSFTNYVYELRNTINGVDLIKDDITSRSNGRLETDEFDSSQEFHKINDFNRIKRVDTARESSSSSENPFIEQVGITSPFFKNFVPVKENVSWVKPSVHGVVLRKEQATPKSTFKANLGFKKSTQWISQNNYPYKVEKNLLSSSQASQATSPRKGKGLLNLEKGVSPKGNQAQKVYGDSLSDISRNMLQGKYNKFHTLPIFSTFIYKEWSHRFSFLEYFIWSARENDLALPFYIRQGTCHMARINAMNLIRNQIGLEKTPKEFLFGFNNCFLRKKNIIRGQIQVCAQSASNVLQQPSEKEFQGSKKNTDTVSNFLHSNSRNNFSFGTKDAKSSKIVEKTDNNIFDNPFLPLPAASFRGPTSDEKLKSFSSAMLRSTSRNENKYFLELRDKRVSLALSISPPSQLKNSTAQRFSTPTIEQNSTPVPLIVPNPSIELVDPKGSLLGLINNQEKSLCVFRQIEKFFAWGSSLSSEKIAMTNWFDFSGLQSRTSSCTPGATVGTEEGLPTKGSYNSPKNSIDSSTTLNKFVLPKEKVQHLDSNIELKISSLRKKTASSTSSFSKAGTSAPKVQEQATNSLASGNFQQLEANNDNKTQSTTSWQESSLMWGKVDDTQQFPRLSELLHFTGGTALRHLLSRFHLVLLGKFLRHELKNLELKINFLLALKMLTYSQGLLLGKLAKRRSKQIRRLKLLELFQSKKSNPEWMVLSVLPVLPPDLRPILRVNDDFVVASDLNRLYQTVLRRNNTIHERLDDPLPCPESGLFRQRSLQKAVDGLLENGKGGGTPLCASKRRPLVSLSHVLKGKKGLFRQHLLGKRVDYSGRSVIVVGPKLNLHECGLPKEMALELFQPFLIHRLKIKGLATSNTAARRMIQQEDPIIWQTVKQLVYEHPVLLNRAPTLHRLGIQAFQPRLVSGRAILLHPLVCNGFNADFDGDQMAVHVPLSFQARAEAWKIMWSKNNLLSPATGQPILVPSQDMVLGCYYLSVLLPRVACSMHHTSSMSRVQPRTSQRTPCIKVQPLPSTGTKEQAKEQVSKDSLSCHKPNLALFKDHVQPGFNNNSNLKHLNNIPSYPKDSELEDSFSLSSKENSQGNIQFTGSMHPRMQPRNKENGSAAATKETSFDFEYYKNKVDESSFARSELNFLESFILQSKKVDQKVLSSTATLILPGELKRKSSRLIHPSGFFKKTQHLGFLTDANLLQKMASLPVAASCTPGATNEQAKLPKERKESFGSRGESSCVTNKNNTKKDDLTSNFSNSTHHLKIGHYFSTLQDSLTAYSQGRLQTHTPFWVRLEYSITEENKDTTLLQERSAPPFLETTIVPVSKTLPRPNKIDVEQSTPLEFALLQPRYGCSQELCRTLFQEDPHKIVIEANETLEAPLELRLGADGNLVKILTTFQNHYSSQATLLDQYKEKSIRYMRTTAGRVVINETLFHY